MQMVLFLSSFVLHHSLPTRIQLLLEIPCTTAHGVAKDEVNHTDKKVQFFFGADKLRVVADAVGDASQFF
jgi:hypothetical protein